MTDLSIGFTETAGIIVARWERHTSVFATLNTHDQSHQRSLVAVQRGNYLCILCWALMPRAGSTQTPGMLMPSSAALAAPFTASTRTSDSMPLVLRARRSLQPMRLHR